MPKGKAKSKWNFKKDKCKYLDNSWCILPKYKRCKDCLRLLNGDKACGLYL